MRSEPGLAEAPAACGELSAMLREEVESLIARLGERPYRVTQILHWLHRRMADSVEEMTDLPLALRRRLAEEAPLPRLRIVTRRVSADGTVKLLLELPDGARIEAVSMPYEQRHTICLSTQVGCALGCRFCATGHQGFQRQLTAAEILTQLKLIWRETRPEHRPNIVFMGMGEPLLNWPQLHRALRVLTASWGMDLSKRKITVSTAGIVPGIEALGRSGLGVQLSVSLNAVDDETRERLMPINRRYSLGEVLAACRRYPVAPARRITFEYVMIRGINDHPEQARRLVKLLRGIRAKVNLIPLNPAAHYPGEPPPPERILAFQERLIAGHVSAFIRESKGADIEAACGQLWSGGAA
jgi:23S rRNA (adenine2503-C2)-methyltransferase